MKNKATQNAKLTQENKLIMPGKELEVKLCEHYLQNNTQYT